MSQAAHLKHAYQHCLQITRSHYENFPVASWFLPRHYRQPISVIYAFARTADDFADEGNLAADQRLARLEHYDEMLVKIQSGQAVDDPVFIALTDVIQHYAIPVQLFHDLLTAFKQDVTKNRYANFGEVMDYCRYSANPVGRLLLHLYGESDDKSLAMSDAICSALQLINFYQDISQDLEENDRIYLPQDEMEKFHVTEDQLRHKLSDFRMQQLMRLQLDRALKLMNAGAPLGKVLKGRIGFELRLVILGGTRIAQHLYQQPGNLFARPRLNKTDLLWMSWKALFGR
ncbi:MAG: squalene synthase HpnC [Thioalkalispiraceae bacterium]|jgi:squalene synthase HpnC